MTVAALRRLDRRSPTDRERAQRVLRARLAAGDRGYAIHPGDLDWWWFHQDPRVEAGTTWTDDEVLVELDPSRPEIYVAGPIEQLLPWAEAQLGRAAPVVGFVASTDRVTHEYLAGRGYAPHGETMPVFVLDLARCAGEASALTPPVPAGYEIRALLDEGEAESRADAARSAFESTMDPAMHRARYRRFMASPAYERTRDVVAVAPDGTIAAFAIWWPDEQTGLAQFEPVGTHRDHQGRGLGRAVIAHCLRDMRAAGMGTVRVITDQHRAPAVGLYLAAGFEQVDELTWWAPRGSPVSS